MRRTKGGGEGGQRKRMARGIGADGDGASGELITERCEDVLRWVAALCALLQN